MTTIANPPFIASLHERVVLITGASGGVGAPLARGSTPEQITTQADARSPEPASPPDPEMLDRAAAMFGISRDALIQMDPRERGLLLSGYRAARRASGGTSSK